MVEFLVFVRKEQNVTHLGRHSVRAVLANADNSCSGAFVRMIARTFFRSHESSRTRARKFRRAIPCFVRGSDGESISKVGGPKPMVRVFSPTTRAGTGLERNFIKGVGGKISTFFLSFFFSRTNLKLIKKQEKL